MTTLRHPTAQRFPVIGSEITVGSIALSRLAERVSATPFYAYDRSLLSERVADLRRVLPSEISIHYAIKANPMPALVCHMAGLVDGLDVASGNELRVALDSGMSPHDISFAGPGKSERELAQAVAAGVLINVESMREVSLLATLSKSLGFAARVALRVNPDFELKSSGMKMGGGPRQFGIDAEQAPQALDAMGQAGLAFEGFHIFSGSQNLSAASICEAQTKALDLACRLAERAPGPIKVLNLGGGFGVPYFPGERPLDIEPIGAHLSTVASLAHERLGGVELVVELGRYLVAEAGIYVCRVIDKKVSRGHTFLVVDGGLHHQLAASGNFGQVLRKNYPVEIGTRLGEDAPTQLSSVVGPLCTPLDLLADRMELAAAECGDLVVVYQSGAYGLTASPLGFLSHPVPAEVLV